VGRPAGSAAMVAWCRRVVVTGGAAGRWLVAVGRIDITVK
jgi:hypothetical protein